MNRISRRRGVTLMELLVVVLLIGILAAFGIPQYMKSMETTKADDAAALVMMVATTNRMYALDHGGTYLEGALDDDCNAGSCPNNNTSTDPCNLVRCGYLAKQSFDNNPYIVGPWDPTSAPGCSCPGGGTWSNSVACTLRRTGSFPGTNSGPYTDWSYNVNSNGVVEPCLGTPKPVAQ